MKSTTLLFACAVLIGSGGIALAQGAGAPAGGGGRGGFAACRDDMQKYCADKQGPDRRQCMQDNMSKFSDGCKAAMAAGRPGGGGGAPAGGGGQ